MLILSTSYIGNLAYYRKLLSKGDVVIDLHENYRKQSFRNRCEILSANGRMELTIPVYKSHGNKTKTGDVAIDYTKSWQATHWKSITSAYRNSPYFDEYESLFEPFYHQKIELLSQFNDAIQRQIFNILDIDPSWRYCSKYISVDSSHEQGQEKEKEKGRGSGSGSENEHNNAGYTKPSYIGEVGEMCEVLDASDACMVGNTGNVGNVFDLRDTLAQKHSWQQFTTAPYYQVFSEKLPFEPNLSIIDLLFCEGENITKELLLKQ